MKKNEQIALAKKQGITYVPQLLPNGDSAKQLLVRSRYLQFRHKEHWTYSQQQWAALMSERYPAIKMAYDLSMKLTGVFNHCKCKEEAYKKLALWYNEVEATGIDSFRTVARLIETHYLYILNFNNRSTNASAEAFKHKKLRRSL